MKKSFFFSIFIITTVLLFFCSLNFSNANSSTKDKKIMTKRDGTEEYWQILRQKDSVTFDYQKKAFEDDIYKYLQKNPSPKTRAILTIPIVFHVVWRTSNENIPDSRLQTCIDALNLNFRKKNTDISTAPAQFQAVAADCEIEFCLASKDPQGNPTTGIIRKQTTVTSFGLDDGVKFSSKGGDDSWGQNSYLNIWVAQLDDGIHGYASAPCVGADNIDGIGLDYVVTGYGKGRTAIHEVGHWFGLGHTFQSGCVGTTSTTCATQGDMVCDTPPTAQGNYSCKNQNTCKETPNDEIDMVQNFMDYSGDDCRVLFTLGQKARMRAAYNKCRTSISNGVATRCHSAVAIDAGTTSIIIPNGTICSTTFTPIIKLQNFGASPLTSCIINYKIDALSNQTFSWTGSLASGQSVNVTLPSVTTTGGTHTFTSSTSSPNGSTDGNTSNDQTTSTFNASTSAQQLPFAEGLENTTFPPSGWALNNPDAGSITWARTTTAEKTGTASMFMNNSAYDKGKKHIDELTTPPLNITSVQNPSVTFQVAYQMYSDPATYSKSDTLKIYISTDCGVTWTSLYNKYHTQLITATPVFSTTPFVPTASQWRLETVPLASYSSATNALIKFRHICDYENNLYVDDINVTGIIGVNELNLDNIISIFPNPSDENIFVNFSIFDLGKVDVKVYNLVGEVIANVTDNISVPKKIKINLAEQSNGIYFVEIRTENKSITKKLILNK
ncbi:MAG: M43 family zinc metalloprotease [Bacteroidota bacterium]